MTFVNQAYETIKKNIIDNQYPPGYQVLERQLVDELGMSRTPIREALIRLHNEGLVELMPRKGMRVVPLSPDDMKEIYEVLTGLEVTAVELLGKRKPSKKEITALELPLDKMDKALENDDLDGWAEADAEFHKELLNQSGNKRLASMAATLNDQTHRARLTTLRLRPKPDLSNKEHRMVLEALKKGEWEKAKEIHYQHRAAASKLITEILAYYRLSYL